MIGALGLGLCESRSIGSAIFLGYTATLIPQMARLFLPRSVSSRGEPTITVSFIIAGLFGLALVICLIAYSGAGEVANAMLVIGWWLVPIAAYHIIPMLFSALSWRELLPP